MLFRSVEVAVANPWRAALEESELRQSLLLAMQNHGLTVPFPQLDVHVAGRDSGASIQE